MHKLRVPSKKIISEFKREIWKDQRELRIDKSKGTFIKNFDLHYEIEIEAFVLKMLQDELGEGFVPKVHKVTDKAIHLDYLKGVRVFNLFVDLDYLDSIGVIEAREAKKRILERCIERQKLIQASLYKYRFQLGKNSYKAGYKIHSIIRILSSPLGLNYESDELLVELNKFNEYWDGASKVPFRDATTKNMVLCFPGLWMGNFESSEGRIEKLEYWLKQGNMEWTSAPIYDFDFSSVTDLTVPEDDPISLLLHQRTWRGNIFNTIDFQWIDNKDIDPYRLACGLIVRYFRFGGRKLAYKLIHPRAHQTRFRHDSGEFYFERLPRLVKKYSEDAARDFRLILEFSRIIGESVTAQKKDVDFFLEQYPLRDRVFYADMYPD